MTARRARRARSDRALLVRRVPFGNSSLVVHVLTAEHGRRELMAKGAYRPKSRLSGVLDWFDELELAWTEAADVAGMAPRRSELGQVREGALVVRRRHLTESLPAYRAAHAMTELAEVATRFGAADAAHFELLSEGYDALRGESGDGIGADAVLAAFELALAAELGLSPALLHCAVCGGDAPPVRDGPDPRAAFSATAGGRLCAEDAAEAHGRGARVGTLPTALLEGAHDLGQVPLASARAVVVAGAVPGGDPGAAARRILDFTGRFLDRQLETRPKSRAGFLSAPDRNRAQR